MALGQAVARVVVTDIDESAANAVARQIGDRAQAFRVDVGDRDAVRALANQVGPVVGLAPDPRIRVYAVTKNALVTLALALRAEAAAYGVRVSALCPGYVRSNLLTAANYYRLRSDALVASIPVKPFDPDLLAVATLRGIERNDALILAPFSARIAWWLTRLSPALKSRLDLQAMKQLRSFQQ